LAKREEQVMGSGMITESSEDIEIVRSQARCWRGGGVTTGVVREGSSKGVEETFFLIVVADLCFCQVITG
jgi:hypothetical protein